MWSEEIWEHKTDSPPSSSSPDDAASDQGHAGRGQVHGEGAGVNEPAAGEPKAREIQLQSMKRNKNTGQITAHTAEGARKTRWEVWAGVAGRSAGGGEAQACGSEAQRTVVRV